LVENRRKLLIAKLSERRFAAAKKSLRHGTFHGIFVTYCIFRRGLVRSPGGCDPLSRPSLHRGDGRGGSGSADWRQRALAGRRGRKSAAKFAGKERNTGKKSWFSLCSRLYLVKPSAQACRPAAALAADHQRRFPGAKE